MKKIIKLFIGVIFIVLFSLSYLFEDKYANEWNKNVVKWSGNETTDQVVELKAEEYLKKEFIANFSQLNCFYVIVNHTITSGEGILKIQLMDEDAILFEYNLPLSIIDKEGYYIPNVCDSELEINKKYTILLSAENFEQDKVEIRQEGSGEILIGLNYSYIDKTMLYAGRGIIVLLFLLNIFSTFLRRKVLMIALKIKAFWCNKNFELVKKRTFIFVPLVALIFAVIMYDAVLSMVTLFALILSSWCLGIMLEKYVFNTRNDEWITFALGFGGIGCIIYFIFELGIGKLWVVGTILSIPILTSYKIWNRFSWKKFSDTIEKKIYSNKLYYICMCIIIYFCIIFAFSPVDDADALVKHIPITVYASNDGRWYHNIIEDILAYSESTLLPYCYSVIFALVGDIKGYILVNVFLMFGIYGALLKFLRQIYPNIRRNMFALLFFSTPLFFSLGTSYMVDILPAFFVSVILLDLIEMKKCNIVEKLPQIAFLFGLCVFSKLTILSSLCIISIIILGMVVKWSCGKEICMREKVSVLMKAFGKSFVCFVSPFAISFARNYYMTGNPFSISAYNNIFKSPYFFQYPFDRPFSDIKFELSLNALYNLIFYTNKYIEMYPFGIGIFLGLALLVPFTWFFYRKKEYISWSLVPIAIYFLGGMIVANLRYIWNAFAMELGIIVISCSICLDKMKRKSVSQGCYIAWVTVLLLPNLWYINKHMYWQDKLIPTKRVTICENSDLLNDLPMDSKVLSINDDQKGMFKGFYWTSKYSNAYITNKINNGKYSLEDFIRDFDYVLFKKSVLPDSGNYNYVKKFMDICSDQKVVKKEAETQTHILYSVVTGDNVEECIVEINYDDSTSLVRDDVINENISSGEYGSVRIEIEYDMEKDEYDYTTIPYDLSPKLTKEWSKRLEQLNNLENHIAELWCGVSWNNSDMIKYDNVVNQCYSSQRITSFGPLEWEDGADRMYFTIRNVSDVDVKLKSLKVYGIKLDSILQSEIEDFYNRKLLRNVN